MGLHRYTNIGAIGSVEATIESAEPRDVSDSKIPPIALGYTKIMASSTSRIILLFYIPHPKSIQC